MILPPPPSLLTWRWWMGTAGCTRMSLDTSTIFQVSGSLLFFRADLCPLLRETPWDARACSSRRREMLVLGAFSMAGVPRRTSAVTFDGRHWHWGLFPWLGCRGALRLRPSTVAVGTGSFFHGWSAAAHFGCDLRWSPLTLGVFSMAGVPRRTLAATFDGRCWHWGLFPQLGCRGALWL